MQFYELPSNLMDELTEFDGQIKEFRAGNISPVQFKGIRVAQGVYQQRKPNTFMMRIRCPAGGVTPKQLRRMAEVSTWAGAIHFHVTTRQELQLHYVELENVIKVYHQLHEVGLSGRGGGGNTVRNIMVHHSSGTLPEEKFDVTPYAIALSTRMIAEPDSWNLPRKFKISFSNTEKDFINATATCLGFMPKMKEGKKGFQLWAAGGMGAAPKESKILMDWVAEDKVYYVVKAIKIMFDKHGNRRQRSKAKLKWMWEKVGEQKFKELFYNYYDILGRIPGLELKLPEIVNQAEVKEGYQAEDPIDSVDFEIWKRRNVVEQKQEGLHRIRVPLRLGDIINEDGIVLADLLENFGDNTIRLSINQNLHIRNIPTAYLGNIFNVISKLQTLSDKPVFAGNMVSCTGAATCTLGVCLSRNLTDTIQEKMYASDLDLDALDPVRIHTSGCPNSCGIHYAADLGFFGRAGKKNNVMYPAFNIVIGGEDRDRNAMELAEKVDYVAAKQLPDLIVSMFKYYNENKDKFGSFRECLRSEGGRAFISENCEELRGLVPTVEEDPLFFKDWGTEDEFSILKGKKAECSAGLFDMIGEDFKKIQSLQSQLSSSETPEEPKEELLHQLAVHSAHSLLVTRGIETRSDEQTFGLFNQHFIRAGLVPHDFQEVISVAKAGDKQALLSYEEQVIAMSNYMKELYDSMDDSLRFTAATLKSESTHVESASEEPEAKASDSVADVTKDFRGVGCPMNFVKTKLALSPMSSGQTLEILLDDGEPIENVPGSVKLEGHIILEQTQTDAGHWSVLIQKS